MDLYGSCQKSKCVLSYNYDYEYLYNKALHTAQGNPLIRRILRCKIPNFPYFGVQNTNFVSKIRCQNTKLFIAFCWPEYGAFCFGILELVAKYEFAILKYCISKYEICNIKTVFWNQSQNTDLQIIKIPGKNLINCTITP